MKGKCELYLVCCFLSIFIAGCAGGVGQGSGSLTLDASTKILSFGSVAVGSDSALPVTLTNAGSSNVTISDVTLSGAGFNATGLSSGQTIAPGKSAALNVTFAPASAGTVTGGITVTSDAANASIAVTLAGTGATEGSGGSAANADPLGPPTCGKNGDTSIEVPNDWSTFVPPAKGQSYVDSSFGCTVTRITDASSEDYNGAAYMPLYMGYATVSPFNANDTYLMLSDGWNRHFVTDLTGNIVVSIASMPASNDSWFLWDATNPAVFYYTSGNSLMQGAINGSSVTNSTIHQFTEYAAINFMDEADVSEDGAHVVIIGGDNSGSSPENVFDYDFVTNVKGAVLTTACTGVINNTNNACLHKLVQTPDNNIMVDFAPDGTGTQQGLRLWTGAALSDPLNASTTLLPLQDTTNHTDAGKDMNGNAVFIAIGNSYVLPGQTNNCPSGWGTDVINVYNPTVNSCLVDIDLYGGAYLSNEHVGYRGNSSQPWVGLSFFDNRTPSPEWFDNSGDYVAPNSSNWQYFEDEIDVVRIDANNNSQYVYRLAHAYSRSNEDFYTQPHGAVSRDGRYVAFNSDSAYAHSGCPANSLTPAGCTDVYIIKIK